MEWAFILTIILPAAVSFLFDFLDKHSNFSNKPRMHKQFIIGVAFGLCSVCATEFGISYNEGILNVRDAAPLCAGLLFGAPAGLIAGLIGGIERWFSVMWNYSYFTRIACTISAISCGVNAGVLRIIVFEDKRPSFSFGLAIAIASEVLHMLLILITNMSAMSSAFEYVSYLAIPMILLTAFSVGISFAAVGKRIIHSTLPRPMIHDFANALFIAVVVMFVVSASLTQAINGNFAKSEAKDLLDYNLDDITNEIDANGISYAIKHWRVGQSGGLVILDRNMELISATKDGYPYLIDTIPEVDIERNTFYEIKIRGEDTYCEFRRVGIYYAFAFIPCEEADVSRNITLYMIIFIESLIYITTFFIVYQILKLKVVEPLHKVNAGLDKICNNELDTVIKVDNNMEFASLSSDINQTVTVLKDHIEDAKKRIERELELAKHIQKTAVPFIFPPFPKRKDFEIYAHMNTAKEVGGDFYDFYFADDNHFCFLIADVSGKGIPAAMFMMASKTLIKGLAEKGVDVDKVFAETNRSLCDNNDAGMFLTAWMGVVDLNTGHLTYANAGHNPPLLYRKNKGFEYIKDKPSFILAGLETTKYRKYEIDLNPGDGIYLYTDGVTEANNIDSNLYGEDRLYKKINEISDMSTEDICLGIEKDVAEYAEGAEQSDDITMLCFKMNYAQSSNSIIVYPDSNALNSVNDFLLDKLSTINVSKNILNKIQICNDEIYSNVMNYSGASTLDVKFALNNEQLVLTYKDNGRPYDPCSREDPDTSLALKDREIGGLGIYMVKKMCKSLDYKYDDNHNVLSLMFDLK